VPKRKDARNRQRLADVTRRELLKMTPLLLGGALVSPSLRKKLLRAGLSFSDTASARLFNRQSSLSYPDSAVVPFSKFPYNYFNVLDPEVDLERWTLTVAGDVQRPGEYTLAQVMALPKVTQNTRHVCVEGWDVIGNFAGARIRDFLTLVGASPMARFLEVECSDDYYESIDMESAQHPQSLLCYEMYGQPLERGHGAPLRLQMPTKLGYKQAKYLETLRVTDVISRTRGYWEDQGYSWYGGL
jgi:DMSO/TMAO reductase YedYZ molybdopterin-dependent catalytic subunit